MDAEEKRPTAEHQAARVLASEGLTAEELVALGSFASDEGAVLVAFDRTTPLDASNRKSGRKRYAAQKEAGLCVRCSAALEPTSAVVECRACLDKYWGKRLRQKYQSKCTQKADKRSKTLEVCQVPPIAFPRGRDIGKRGFT
jgi:hypothetical protein